MNIRQISILFAVVIAVYCSASSHTAQATVISVQTLSNYTYELQEQWKYSWEECDTDLYPLQSPISIDGSSDQCPQGQSINILFQAQQSNYKLASDRLSMEYRYSLIHTREPSSPQRLVYQSSSIHFHNHGQHTVNSLTGDLQIHINYKLILGESPYRILILAVPILVSSTPNSSTDHYLTIFERDYSHVVNFGDVFAMLKQAGVYRYRGSLSTPPCLGEVTWLVADRVMMISQEDLVLWRVVINQGRPNNRAQVPLAGRQVTYFAAHCREELLEIDQVLGDGINLIGVGVVSLIFMLL